MILNQARHHPLTREICAVLQGEPAAILVVKVQDNDKEVVEQRISAIATALESYAYCAPVMTKADEIRRVWELRRSALGLMNNVKGSKKLMPYIEDAAIPSEHLADYVSEVLAICELHGQSFSMFGHASVGLIHIRPLHHLHQDSDITRLQQIQEEVFQLVLKYRGSWSAEHGEGIVRGGYNQRFFGEEIYQGFRTIKHLFDPEGRMNPGKMLDINYSNLYSSIGAVDHHRSFH